MGELPTVDREFRVLFARCLEAVRDPHNFRGSPKQQLKAPTNPNSFLRGSVNIESSDIGFIKLYPEASDYTATFDDGTVEPLLGKLIVSDSVALKEEHYALTRSHNVGYQDRSDLPTRAESIYTKLDAIAIMDFIKNIIDVTG